MTEDLDQELKQLVMNNWGLVYELHERAETLRKELLERTLAACKSDEVFASYQLGEDEISRSSAYWYIGFPHEPWPHVSYVQVQVETTNQRPQVKVYTAFRQIKGFGTVETKMSIPEELRAAMGADFDSSGMTMTVVSRVLDLRGTSIDELVHEVVSEVERQMAVAAVLRDVIAERVPAD